MQEIRIKNFTPSPKKENNKYNKYYGIRALKNKDNSYNSNNWHPHPVAVHGCGCFSKL